MAMGAIAALSAGCSTLKTVVHPTAAPAATVAVPAETVAEVAASKEFLSIAEAAAVVTGRSTIDDVARRYGYKTIDNYGIYRLDSYDKMLYRNCTPAKSMGNNVYADVPRPQKKGTSSYVAVTQTVTIGVFNTAAYQNLVDQVTTGGFRLVETGYEDRYTNGTVDVYCYSARKTVRVERAAQ